MEITFLPTNTSEIHLHVEKSYRTPTERWQKTPDFPKGKKLPTYLGREKEKTETKEYRWDLHLWDGAVKEEKFLQTRKPLHWWSSGVGGREASEPRRRGQQKV